MPQVIQFVALAASSIATTTLAANAIFLGVYGALSIGLSVGLSFLASALMPKPKSPRPEDVQQATRQPTAPRFRHYGRVKVSGNWAFAEASRGNFHKVVALGQGPIDAFEEYWVDDRKVNLDSNGFVTGSDLFENNVRILTRRGTVGQSHYSQLTAVFSQWTSTHIGKGVASLYATQFASTQENYLKRFPNGIHTNYRVVIRGSLIENPLTGVVAWDDNAASVIRDYLYHVDGMRLPKSFLTTPLANAGWKTAYEKCAVPYNKKGGGTENRYRIWGSYTLEERPADVLNRMLTACDGRLVITPDGGLTIDVGDYVEPTFTLDGSMITNFSDVGKGRDILTTANTIRATFMNPDQDYQSSDADPWYDADDVETRGEIAQDIELHMSPSHSQTRRLMKINAYRAAPQWVGIFICNLKALPAFGQRFIRINYPALGINGVFELNDFQFDMVENNIIQSVTLRVSSMPASAYSWDASQEEGEAPVAEETDPDSEIPEATGFNVSIFRKTISGQQVPFARLTFDASPSAALLVKAEGKLASDSQWTPISVAEGATTADSFALSDGSTYEFRIWYETYSTRRGAKTSPPLSIVAIGDPTPPASVNSVVVTPGGPGEVDFSWQSPNSANFAATVIRRNTTNTEGSATIIHTEYGAANFPFTYTDDGLSAGTYYYWLRSRNASGVESNSAVASGPIVVT